MRCGVLISFGEGVCKFGNIIMSPCKPDLGIIHKIV
jgi:hypothetical protein